MWKLLFAGGRTLISEILTLQNIHYFFLFLENIFLDNIYSLL